MGTSTEDKLLSGGGRERTIGPSRCYYASRLQDSSGAFMQTSLKVDPRDLAQLLEHGFTEEDRHLFFGNPQMGLPVKVTYELTRR